MFLQVKHEVAHMHIYIYIYIYLSIIWRQYPGLIHTSLMSVPVLCSNVQVSEHLCIHNACFCVGRHGLPAAPAVAESFPVLGI